MSDVSPEIAHASAVQPPRPAIDTCSADLASAAKVYETLMASVGAYGFEKQRQSHALTAPISDAADVSIWTKGLGIARARRHALAGAQRGLPDAVEDEVEALAGGNVHRGHHAPGDHDHTHLARPAALDGQVGKPRQRSQWIIGFAGSLEPAVARQAAGDAIEVERGRQRPRGSNDDAAVPGVIGNQ